MNPTTPHPEASPNVFYMVISVFKKAICQPADPANDNHLPTKAPSAVASSVGKTDAP